MRQLRFTALSVLLCVAIISALALTALPANRLAVAATNWYVSTTGSDVTGDGSQGNPWQTIAYAVANASVQAGDTINVAAGIYAVDSQVNLNKADLTLAGAGSSSTVVQVSGTGYRFYIAASGVTIDGFGIEKTDKAGVQNIIYVGASNVSITNNDISGQFVIGDGDVSRGIEVAGGLSGLDLTGNTIHELRQPAYINGVSTGTISNNYVYLTRGWVVAEGNMTFTGNTWGTGTDANVYDIAILSTVNSAYYADIPAMAAANNNAFIEDQRTSPPTLSIVYVDGSVASSGDGTARSPVKTITEGIARVVIGGTVNVLAGTYAPSSTIIVNKNNLSLLGPQANVDPRPSKGSSRTAGSPMEAIIDGTAGSLGNIILVDADGVLINGFEVKSGTSDMIRQSNAHSGTVVKHNIIHDGNGDEGVQLANCTNGILEYNYVFDIANPGDALNIANSSGGAIRFNEVANIGSVNAAIYCYATSNTDIIGNLVYNVDAGDNNYGNGIQMGDNAEGVIYTGGQVKDNVVYNVAQDGICIDWMSSVTVQNNTVYGADSHDGAIYLRNVHDSTFTNNRIYNNDAIGILILSCSGLAFTDNDIYDNADTNDTKYPGTAGIWIVSDSDSSTISIHNNNIYGNAEYGLLNADTLHTVDATNNWWGSSPPGPYHPAGNPGGLGNPVSDYVAFDPWKGKPSGVAYSPSGTYEQFTGQLGSASAAYVYGSNQVCQTFTPSKSHYFNSVSLMMWRYGTTAYTVTISLYGVDGSLRPTGDALCSTSFAASSLSTTAPKAWRTLSFAAGCQVSAGTEYALVISANGGTLTKRVNIRTWAADGYSRGLMGTSTDAGASWLMNSGADMAFKEGQGMWHESQASTIPGIIVSGQNQAYQTFTPSRSHYLNYVSLYLYKIGYPTYTVTISLHNVDGSGQPSGDALCSTSFAAKGLTTKAAWRTYRFLSGCQVSAGTTYALVISAGGSYGYVVAQAKTADGYAAGDCGRSTDGGSTWQAISGPDLAFREGEYPWYTAFGSSNSAAYVYGENHLCQTFTPAQSHYFEYVSLSLSRVGTPDYTVTISLYNVDENHQPAGSALRSTTFSASSVTLPKPSYSTFPWYEFRFASGYQLSAGTEYALVLSGNGGDTANSVTVRIYTKNYYAGGQRGSSADGGATWQMIPTQDMTFMEGGAETSAQAGSGSYEQFTGQLGATSTAYVYDQKQVCQTFTPSRAHYFNSASLWIYRTGTPNLTVSISLYNTSGGQPTGSALSSTTCYAGYLPTSLSNWRTFSFASGYHVSAGTQYALVISASGGTRSNLYNRVNVRTYAADGYSGGRLGTSGDAGGTWAMNSAADMAFKEGQNIWHESQLSATPGIVVSGQNQAYQSFTASRTHYLNYLHLYLYKVGYPTYTVTISLHNVDGSGQPSGDPLCSTTFLASSLSTRASWRAYRFATGYQVSAGTQYALVISAGGSNGSVVLQANTADGYAGGDCGLSSDAGTSWQTLTGPDLAFREGEYPWYAAFGTSNSAASVHSQNQLCQTFKPSQSHYFEYVALSLSRVGLPNYTVTISLYNVDENHQPVGSALCSTTFAASSVTLPRPSYSTYPWYEFRFGSGCQLSAGTEYGLVLSANGGDAANTVTVRINTRNYYPAGQRGSSTDGGNTWTMIPTQDMTFMAGGMN